MIEARRKRTAALAVTVLVAGLIGTTVASVARASAAPPASRPRSSRPATPAPTPAAGTYVALTPARVFDGRRDGVAAPHATVVVPVLGRVGVPSAGVGAIALTVTVTGQTSSGYVTAYPAGTARPATSNVNFMPGQDVANSVVVPTGSGGAVDLYNDSAGNTDFVVDVSGYYRSGPATVAGAFTAITPIRRLDTRTGMGGAAPGAGDVVRVDVGIANATVLMNLTVTGPVAGGHVTAYSDGTALPVTSNLSFGPGQTVANQVLVAVGANRVVDLYNASTGTTQLILDVVGRYRAGPATTPGALQPVTPQRQRDTRRPPGTPIAALGTLLDPVAGTAGIPASGVSAVLLDVTVVTPARSGYLQVQTVGGPGTVLAPTSSLNFTAGHTVAGLLLVAAGTAGIIELSLRSSGSANVVVDVLGFTLDGPGTSRGSISGIVSVSAGIPDDLAVRAYTGTHVVVSTRTAGDGTYTLAGLAPSTIGYDVCVVAPNDGLAGRCVDGVQWNSPNPPPDSTPVPVQGGTLRGNVDVQLSAPLPTGVITGRLTATHTGTPVAGASVGLGDQFEAATTRSDGSYRIDDVGPGSYHVCFTPDNNIAGTPPTGYAAACHAGDVTVATGTTAGVNGILPIGAAISGRVTAAADATVLANAQVSASFAGAGHFFGATTAADGTYRIIGLTGGTSVTVCFSDTGGTDGPSHAGYLDACYHTGVGTDPTPVTVTTGSTSTGIDAALTSGGAISGTVLGGTTGVDGVDVYAISADGFIHNSTESGTDGKYTVTGMTPGTYTVCFQYDADFGGIDYQDQCYHDVAWDGGAVPGGLDPVTVTAGVVTDNIDASLTPS